MARQFRSTVEAKTLSAGINSSVGTITLNSVTTLPSSYPYTLVIDPDLATEEIISVTASGGGNSLTVTRGRDGTPGQSHNAAAVVKHMITAQDLQEPHDHIDNTTAHDATGGVVGVSKTQTLTNKTLTSPTINTPTITSPTISGTITGAVVTSANIVDGTIVNADINASAGIVATKLTGTTAEFNTALSDGDFATIAGSQTLTNKTLTSPVVTGGTLNGGAALTVDSTELNYVDGVTSSIQTQLTTINSTISTNSTSISNNTPVGSMTMFGGSTAPTGWLVCDGSQVAIATYGSLYGVLSTNYGALTNGAGATGTTHFRLPDLRGRIPMGVGTGRNAADTANLTARAFAAASFSKISDAETQTLTEANLPSHDHTIGWQSDGTQNHDHALNSGSVTRVAGPSDGGASGTGTINSGLAGSGTGHNNIQPSTIVNFIIKY